MNASSYSYPSSHNAHTRKTITLVYVCSGAADVGEITDRAARQLTREGIAVMSCLASIGARDDDITWSARLADHVLLIDGCPRACARRTFEQAGLDRPWLHLDLSALGLSKGRSPVTQENVCKVVAHVAKLLSVTPRRSGNG